MEKIDIHNREKNFERIYEAVKKSKIITEKDKKKIDQFVNECIIGKNSSKKVGKSRLFRYLENLKFFAEYFRKPFSQINEKDIERFYHALETNKIKRKDGKPYSPSTKNEFIKTMKKFFRWFYHDQQTKYQKIFGWLKSFEENKEIPALTRKEVEKMASLSDTRDAALIMFLFDSGCRIEELLNIRLEDLKKEQIGKDLFYKVRIRVSKTKPRTLVLTIATKYLDAWLQEHPEKNNPNALLFPMNYDAVRITLARKGKKIGKRVYPHLLRHSSATYFANVLKNPFKLCYRFGWTMNSDQAQRYIDREGLQEEEMPEIIKHDEISKLTKENELLKEDIARIKEEQEKIMAELERRKRLDPILDKLFKNKQIEKILERQIR